MTRRERNSRDAEHFLAALAGLIGAVLVHVFLRGLAIYFLAATVAAFGWLLWRRNASHTDFTIRFGLGTFIVALAAGVIRPYLNLG